MGLSGGGLNPVEIKLHLGFLLKGDVFLLPLREKVSAKLTDEGSKDLSG
jgi:hypothetical protein